MKTYFVTGATGAVGAALIPVLLKQKGTHVRLLIRANNPDHLSLRLEDLMKFWEIPIEDTATRERIKAVRGDVSLPRFGLKPAEYEALAEECTHIIHSAGNVRMNLPLAEARKSSVDSVRHIVDLANRCNAHGNLRKVEIVSTIGVGGKMKGEVPERWIHEKREFHNTYEQAKAEAEQIVEKEIRYGLPATVHRPSMVVGDSTTGKIIHFQVFYHICEFLSGRRTLGVLPNVKGTRLDIIPVDYVAKAIAWSSTQNTMSGRVLHMCSGPENSIDLVDLTEKVRAVFQAEREALPKVKFVPLWVFKTALPVIGLFVSSKSRRAIKALPVFFEYLAEEQTFQNRQTKENLLKADIPLPQIQSYLEMVLSAYLTQRQNQGRH